MKSDRMDTRRRFVLALGAATLTAPLPSWAQQKERVRRIGFLAIRARPSATNPDASYAAFVKGMQKLGWVEGKNLQIEWRYAYGDYAALPKLATELVQNRVELIVTHTTPGTQAAKAATATIPIVTAAVSDPVGSGLVPSLARPGGNITGISNMGVDMAPKQLETLKILLPKLSTVAFVLNPGTKPNLQMLESLQAAAGKFNVKVVRIDARTAEELDAGFAGMKKQRVEAAIVANDGFFVGQRQTIAALGIKDKMPTVFSYREHVESGGLMSYGENLADVYATVATYVDKILKGAKAGELPFEQPNKLQLTINAKTAKALGIKVPQELLIRADEVIE